jgi:hypothetical protein
VAAQALSSLSRDKSNAEVKLATAEAQARTANARADKLAASLGATQVRARLPPAARSSAAPPQCSVMTTAIGLTFLWQ